MSGSRPALQMGNLSLAQVRFHPRNVRRGLGDLRELVASIEAVGVLQPVSVDWFPDFLRLRAGHRRVAAARMAGLKTIPGIIHRTPLTDEQFIVGALHENLHRRDLDPAERAEALAGLKVAGLSTLAIAERLGISAATVRVWAGGGTPQQAEPDAVIKPSAIEPASAYQNKIRYSRPSRARVLAIVEAWRPIAAAGLSPEKATALLDEMYALVDVTGTDP